MPKCTVYILEIQNTVIVLVIEELKTIINKKTEEKRKKKYKNVALLQKEDE